MRRPPFRTTRCRRQHADCCQQHDAAGVKDRLFHGKIVCEQFAQQKSEQHQFGKDQDIYVIRPMATTMMIRVATGIMTPFARPSFAR